MPTITMNILLPDSLKAFVDQRVADRGYGSHSEYVLDLVRRDELQAAKDQMRSLIAAGVNSPTGKPWAEFRDELLQRAKSSKRAVQRALAQQDISDAFDHYLNVASAAPATDLVLEFDACMQRIEHFPGAG